MKTHISHLLVATVLIAVSATVALSAPFEPLFRITGISGTCTVSTPEMRGFEKAEEGKAYPYGSTVKTERRSSALIVFSEGNQCRLLANCTVTINEKSKDKSLKVIKLDAGKIEVELEEGFSEHNALDVETATAICGAIGCTYSVEAMTQDGLTVTVVVVDDGKVRVYTRDFSAMMDSKDSFSVAGSNDGLFTRLRNITGTIPITVRDSKGTDRVIETKPEAVFKIWRRETDEGTVVTILIAAPSGELDEVINYLEEAGFEEKRQEGEPVESTPEVTEVESTPEVTETEMEIEEALEKFSEQLEERESERQDRVVEEERDKDEEQENARGRLFFRRRIKRPGPTTPVGKR